MMSKKVKKNQNSHKGNSSIINKSDSSLTIRSLQKSLNKLSDQFKSLKDEDFYLNHRLKIKILTNSEKNLHNFISDRYLVNFINNDSSALDYLYQNLNHRPNVSNFSLGQDMVELIAKEAILVFKQYNESKIPKSRQISKKF
jgi:hypothetical protein